MFGSDLPGIGGESGYVQEYDPFGNRYHVRLNNGHVYHLASRHLAVTQAPVEAVPLPPMERHLLPAVVKADYKPPLLCLHFSKPPKPDAKQPELRPPLPAPTPVGNIDDAPPPPPAGPVPAGPSVKQSPPTKPARPLGSSGSTRTRKEDRRLGFSGHFGESPVIRGHPHLFHLLPDV